MSSRARNYHVLFVSGYANRFLLPYPRHSHSASKNKSTFTNNHRQYVLSSNIIETCIMYYNGLCFHVEIEKGTKFSELNEELIERHCHPLSWSNIDATAFDVRRGPNYVDGQKSKSKPALYTIFKYEGYVLPRFKMHKLWHYLHPTLGSNGDEFERIIKRYSIPPPTTTSASSSSSSTSSADFMYTLPPLLMINVMIPNYNPEMSTSSRSLSKKKPGGKVKNDGAGYSGIIYAHLSDSVHHKLARNASSTANGKHSSKHKHKHKHIQLPLSPAIKLVSNFMRGEQHKVDRVRERFKCMARVMNGKHAKFGFVANKLIKKYNAKPFLAKTSTEFYYEPNRYFAIDIDLHAWSYAAKKGLYLLKNNANKTIYDMAFTIEGRQDDELPEQILCAARVSKLGLNDMCAPLPPQVADRYLLEHANMNHKK